MVGRHRWRICAMVWPLLLLLLLLAALVGASQLPATSPTPSSTKRDGGARGLNPSVVIIVVILTVVFFLSGFLHLLARCCGRVTARRELTDNAMSALHGQLQHLFHLHDSGVDQSFIDTLPVFPYKAICGLKEATDCAVCLSEFEGEDRLRLLPKCKHAFHLDCIDTWLLSHSTCPLCRCSLLPDEASPLHANFSDSGRVGSTRSLPSESAFFGDSRRTSDSRRVTGDESHVLGEPADGSDSDSGKDYDRVPGQESPEIQPVLSRSDSLKSNASSVLSVQLGRVGKAGNGGNSTRGRSYSMGSYEYIVDPSNLQVVIAPTPYPGRGNIKAEVGKPRHRSVFSDSIPELGSIPSTPSDEMFWASLGLAITNVDISQELPPRKSSSRSLASLPEAELENNLLSVEDVEQDLKPDETEDEVSISVEEQVDEGEISFRKQCGSEKSLEFQLVKGTAEQPVEKETENPVSNRTFSLRFPLPDGKNRVGKSRRTMSETTGLASLSSGAVDCVWRVPLNQHLPQAVEASGESSSRGVQSIARKTIHWLMGRDKRMVFAAFSPSPDAQRCDDL